MNKVMVLAALLVATMVCSVALGATEQVSVSVPAETPATATQSPAARPDGPYLDGNTAYDAVAREKAADAKALAERALARPSTVVKKTTVKKYYRTRVVRVPVPVQKPAPKPVQEKKVVQNFFAAPPAVTAPAAASAAPWWGGWLGALLALALIGLAVWAIAHAVTADPRWRRSPDRTPTTPLDPHQAGHWILREFSGPHGSWRSATPDGVAIVESDNRARAEEARAHGLALAAAARAEAEAYIAMARNARLANVAAACTAQPIVVPVCRPCGGGGHIINIGALYQGTAEQALARREAPKPPATSPKPNAAPAAKAEERTAPPKQNK